MKCYTDTHEHRFFVGAAPNGWLECPIPLFDPYIVVDIWDGYYAHKVGAIWETSGEYEWRFFYISTRSADLPSLLTRVKTTLLRFDTTFSPAFYRSPIGEFDLTTVEGRWWRKHATVAFELESDYLACEMMR